MKRANLVVAGILAVMLCAGVAYWAVAGRSPGKQIEAGGRTYDVTPAEKMRVRTAEGQPDINPDTYSLEISGLVRRPREWSLAQVKALPAEERFVKLPCVEGWTEAGVWKGPRLRSLLDAAGVKEDAATVVFRSPGGYSTSLTLEDVRRTDPLLAYGVNGDRLTASQGYPMRLVVPGRLGYKWIKWVTDIELVEGGHEGYWESRGYSNEADAPGR